jgi:hypothetical protein
VKVKTVIPARKFRCPEGRVKAQGKGAAPAFCFRVAVEKKKERRKDSMIDGRVSVIEIYSTATGRKIGYIGEAPKTFVKKKSGANRWIETQHDRSLPPYDTPDQIGKKVERFLEVAQDQAKGVNPQFAKTARSTWNEILREATR